VLGCTPVRGRRARTDARVNANMPATGGIGGQGGGLTTAGKARLGKRRACVGEGGGTCKKFHPSLARRPASAAAARRCGASVRSTSARWPGQPQEGRISCPHLGGHGPKCRRRCRVGCGSPARRKKRKAAARRWGSRGSRGSSRSRRRRVRLLPRAAPVFAADGAPTDGSNSSFSPLHFSSSGRLVGGQGSDFPPRRLGLGLPPGARRWLK
jgi:hypothetical protein